MLLYIYVRIALVMNICFPVFATVVPLYGSVLLIDEYIGKINPLSVIAEPKSIYARSKF